MELKIHNLSFAFDGLPVLEDVSFTAAGGTLTAVLGPNGAGKTTLLRCLTGALIPATGSVTMDNRPVTAMSPRQRARLMALVPQSGHLEFAFTVLETVLMGRNPWLGRWAAEGHEDYALARDALARVGMQDFEARPVTELSGGELQRALVARALCQQTPILFMDEPVSHLDIRYQVQILDIARRQAEAGQCVLCVLHDLNLAARYAHRILMLKDRRLAADGTPDEVLRPELLESIYDLPMVRVESQGLPFLTPRR